MTWCYKPIHDWRMELSCCLIGSQLVFCLDPGFGLVINEVSSHHLSLVVLLFQLSLEKGDDADPVLRMLGELGTDEHGRRFMCPSVARNMTR